MSAICQSVSRITESNQPMSLKLGVVIGPTNQEKRLTFGSDPVQNTYQFSISVSHRRIGDYRRFISMFYIITTSQFLQYLAK